MAELLVSVRSAEEALAALEGGASIIDVKEPLNGSLGRASAETIASVVQSVAGRVPISVALGELADLSEVAEPPRSISFRGIHYVKWGLANSGANWRRLLINAVRRHSISNPGCTSVVVGYSDWQQAQAPPLDDVLTFTQENAWSVFLLDTWKKDGRTLLDWLSLEHIGRLCQQCHLADIRIGLAGSLGRDQIRALLPLKPDIFAVRGAVCRHSDRTGTVDPRRVRRLVDLLAPARKLRVRSVSDGLQCRLRSAL
jgi:uncharacterized protein (UPF0264 family)